MKIRTTNNHAKSIYFALRFTVCANCSTVCVNVLLMQDRSVSEVEPLNTVEDSYRGRRKKNPITSEYPPTISFWTTFFIQRNCIYSSQTNDYTVVCFHVLIMILNVARGQLSVCFSSQIGRYVRDGDTCTEDTSLDQYQYLSGQIVFEK